MLLIHSSIPLSRSNNSLRARIHCHGDGLSTQWLSDQEWLERTDNDTRQLQEIFSQLRSLPGISVHVLGIDDAAQKPTDFTSLAADYGDSPPLWPEWTNNRPLQIVLSALEGSAIQLTALSVISGDYDVPLTFFAPKSGFWKIRGNLSRVTCLGFLIQAGPEGLNSLSSIDAVANFVKFLDATAATLESLQLYAIPEDKLAKCTASDLNQVFGMMTETLVLPRLKAHATLQPQDRLLRSDRISNRAQQHVDVVTTSQCFGQG